MNILLTLHDLTEWDYILDDILLHYFLNTSKFGTKIFQYDLLYQQNRFKFMKLCSIEAIGRVFFLDMEFILFPYFESSTCSNFVESFRQNEKYSA